ncbi:MAG: DUF6036 family nucleotidyltransferase [Burkholderiales bacterium]
MTRSDLEHLIRAAGAIAQDSQIVVVGSQAVLGQFPEAPHALLASMQAGVFPRHRPERADLIEGAIGEGSSFHEQFGYYAQGVSEQTATLPAGWKERLVTVMNQNTGGIEGLCLEVHDLALSKYVAGREKDLAFCALLARHALTRRQTLLQRAAQTKLSQPLRKLVEGRIRRDFPSKDGR